MFGGRRTMNRVLCSVGVATGAAFGAYNYSVYQNGNQRIALAWGGSKAAPAKPQIPPAAENAALPVEIAKLTIAPEVPPPITRRHPVLLVVNMTCDAVTSFITRKLKYDFWAFNGSVPGPFIRARVGDVIEVNVTNKDPSGMPHNIDFHAIMGPGGGAPLLLADENKTKSGHFKMTVPGLFVYHCAAAPVPMHVANGMYGLILVEPEGGLTRVDKEFYVMQSEFYFDEPEKGSNVAPIAYDKGLREDAQAVVLNGREGALTDNALKADAGDRVRIFFGNGGPNLISSFHVIGGIFDYVYREGDLISPPARGIQTTLVPPGGSTVVEMQVDVPGNLTIVDHAIFRLDKGCVGFLNVKGKPNHNLYHSVDPAFPCPDCKLHP